MITALGGTLVRENEEWRWSDGAPEPLIHDSYTIWREWRGTMLASARSEIPIAGCNVDDAVAILAKARNLGWKG